MIKRNHTPGIWTLGEGTVRVRTVGGTLIAECYTTQNSIRYADERQRQANAVLISAAPVLLDACEGLLSVIKAMEDGYSDENARQYLIQQAKCAIAKATTL